MKDKRSNSKHTIEELLMLERQPQNEEKIVKRKKKSILPILAEYFVAFLGFSIVSTLENMGNCSSCSLNEGKPGSYPCGHNQCHLGEKIGDHY